MFRLVLLLTLIAAVYGAPERIVGGDAVEIEQFNYQISIHYRNFLTCGGSLLTSKAVATAAGCVLHFKNDPSQLTVRAGSNLADAGDVRNVAKIIVHEKYVPLGGDYDVAIVFLAEPFSLSEKIGVIALIPENEKIHYSTPAFLTGYGAIHDGGLVTKRLHLTIVNSVNKNICARKYAPRIVSDRMVCWAHVYGGRGACLGDVGGPLVIFNMEDVPYLVGITSWYNGCGSYYYPGVFTDITNPEIREFIVNTSNLTE